MEGFFVRTYFGSNSEGIYTAIENNDYAGDFNVLASKSSYKPAPEVTFLKNGDFEQFTPSHNEMTFTKNSDGSVTISKTGNKKVVYNIAFKNGNKLVTGIATEEYDGSWVTTIPGATVNSNGEVTIAKGYHSISSKDDVFIRFVSDTDVTSVAVNDSDAPRTMASIGKGIYDVKDYSKSKELPHELEIEDEDFGTSSSSKSTPLTQSTLVHEVELGDEIQINGKYYYDGDQVTVQGKKGTLKIDSPDSFWLMLPNGLKNYYIIENKTPKFVYGYDQFGNYVHEVTIEDEGASNKITSIPYTTVYRANDKLARGATKVVQQGVNGTKDASGKVIKQSVDRIIEVGTKPTVKTETIAFKTETVNNSRLAEGTTRTKQEGKNGAKVTTTTYKVDTKTGKVTANTPTVKTTPAVNKIVEKGTKKTATASNATTYTWSMSVKDKAGAKYTYTNEHNVRQTIEVVKGSDGKWSTKGLVPKNVTINKTTGAITIPKSYVAKEPKLTITYVNNKVASTSISKTTSIPYSTVYRANPNVKAGERKVLTKGANGVKDASGKTIKSPVTQVVQVGTKSETTTTFEKMTYKYVADSSVKFGQKKTKTPGTTGKRVRTTTYTLDTKTGKLTAKVSNKNYEGKTVVIGVGNVETVKTTTKNGKSTVTTTKNVHYNVDAKTGKLTKR